jgi:hypothetical protein
MDVSTTVIVCVVNFAWTMWWGFNRYNAGRRHQDEIRDVRAGISR